MGDEQDTCFGPGSIAGAVVGTFFTTILLLAVAALLYRHWRRNKGKHLVLMTDPEIVEDAYAFDNPCFKDATPNAVSRNQEKQTTGEATTPVKDSNRWTSPWTTLGLGSGPRHEKKRTFDDFFLGSKIRTVNVVSLRSHDFTGLGFNVCGNMREGIFVKDLLYRGPAFESGRIHPGDRISSVKISFRNMVYEDALTILSYASPYDVELEVESGTIVRKPSTLLKKSVGPSPSRICHPWFRSQSVPAFPRTNDPSPSTTAKRLFVADPSDSLTVNSTLNSTKSNVLEQVPTSKSNHQKFGIKVLPALDAHIYKMENQNEHNTNLERRHSKNKNLGGKYQGEEELGKGEEEDEDEDEDEEEEEDERFDDSSIGILSDVPTEVQNAAIAARRNRKSNQATGEEFEAEDSTSWKSPLRSPQKNKRRAPAPPKIETSSDKKNNTIETISDYMGYLGEYVDKARERLVVDKEKEELRKFNNQRVVNNRRNSESDTDNELQNGLTRIELNPSDITIHCTPVPEGNDDGIVDEEDVYRKAASLGDLSKYESTKANSTNLERAQSLDMTETGSKKRKAPLPPADDINESSEDLTKLDHIETFDRFKLKKSNKWGTLEDSFGWSKTAGHDPEKGNRKQVISNLDETSLELYNLPLSKRMTEEFIRTERCFNPDLDNSLARIVNDGEIIKNPPLREIELDFRQAEPYPLDGDEEKESSFQLYAKRLGIVEPPATKIIVERKPCPSCEKRCIHTLKDLQSEDEEEFERKDFSSMNSSKEEEDDHRRNISNVSVSSGENSSEDSGLVVRETYDSDKNRPPLPTSPMPKQIMKSNEEKDSSSPRQTMTYITEIKVSANREREEAKSFKREIVITSNGNGKYVAGKKPPVPPRRADVVKSPTDEDEEKKRGVVYVSEYKSTNSSQDSSTCSGRAKPIDIDLPTRNFERWIFLDDNRDPRGEENSCWGTGSSPPQPVTCNIIFSSDNNKIIPD